MHCSGVSLMTIFRHFITVKGPSMTSWMLLCVLERVGEMVPLLWGDLTHVEHIYRLAERI